MLRSIWECQDCTDEIEPEEEMDASNWHPFCISQCPRCGESRPALHTRPDVNEKFTKATEYSNQVLDLWASRYADDDVNGDDNKENDVNENTNIVDVD